MHVLDSLTERDAERVHDLWECLQEEVMIGELTQEEATATIQEFINSRKRYIIQE